MHDSPKREPPQSKSYTSIQYNLMQASELRNTFDCNKHSIKRKEDLIIFHSLTGDLDEKKSASNNSENLNETAYVTSEKYHSLNKKYSDKTVIRSTSTFFYDLDSLAKRHSYHCVTEISEGKNYNNRKVKNTVKNGFGAKSEAIVQECATQMKPRLLTNKYNKETKKKTHKSFHKDLNLTSEIFLREHDGTNTSYKPSIDDNPVNKRHQKFWYFAKYRTEYTNPVAEEKKLKKKDRGKRIEDPCPCQLFSYACPCTNSKSLTKLAKNSKSLTVADQITSTPQEFLGDRKCNHMTKKFNNITTRENKRTSTNDIIEKKSKEILSNEVWQTNINNYVLRKRSDVVTNPKKRKSRKERQVLCSNCREMIDVISTTEEEESLQSKISPPYGNINLPATPLCTYQDPNDNQSKLAGSRDICNHEPQCELVPVCQILPTDNIYVKKNVTNKQSPLKPTPRVIRITKGCRHHPPCTVVPSCQTVNVLNNNCEYVPPCLHRPRCVNLPLCAPLYKSIYYDDSVSKPQEDVGPTECFHLHDIRCMQNHQNERKEKQMSRVQNTYDYISECTPRFVHNSTLGCISPIPSPCQPISHSICKHCKSEKSCQYDFLVWNFTSPVKKTLSNEDVIFIRDVGCQFQNKNYSPKDSIEQYNTSSGSFNMNADEYYCNYDTLRYEDKFNIPISGEELSVSTVSLSFTEIDSQCPTHGRHRNRDSVEGRPTGFVPKSNISPFVGYNSTYPNANFCLSANGNFKEKLGNNNAVPHASSGVLKKQQSAMLVMSGTGFLKGKYKNIFPLKRRRKSKANYQFRYGSRITKKMSEV